MLEERVTVAQRISELKKEKRLSYRDIEKLCGVNRASLQRYATNPNVSVPIDALSKLAKVFNVAPTYLLGYSDREPFIERSDDCEIYNKIVTSIRDFTEEQMEDVLNYVLYIEKRNK